MTIGVAAVIVLVAVGNGSKQQVQAAHRRARLQRAARAGPRRRLRRPGRRRRRPATTLTTSRRRRARATSSTRPTSRAPSPVVNATGTTLVARLDELPAELVRRHDARLRDDARLPGRRRRVFTDAGRQDSTGASSSSARPSSQNLFSGHDPVGQTVRVDGTGFQVVGVTESKGSNGIQDQDDVAHRADHRGAGRAQRLRQRSARSPSRRRRAATLDAGAGRGRPSILDAAPRRHRHRPTPASRSSTRARCARPRRRAPRCSPRCSARSPRSRCSSAGSA